MQKKKIEIKSMYSKSHSFKNSKTDKADLEKKSMLEMK